MSPPLGSSGGEGRLDQPPAPDRYIDLPASFGRRFTIFVDTEEEFDWSKPHSRAAHSTRTAESLPHIHRRLVAAGAKPVYLIDHPIVADPRSVATLREFLEAGECTVGTQLHPWVNPPFEEEINLSNSFAGNLPEALEREKLARLTGAIEAGMGCRPTIYRAGRYGVGPRTARLLEEAGYRIDVSVRPLHDYRGEGGPDFSRVRPTPFWAGRNRTLLEVPLTIAFTGAFRQLGSRLYPAAAKLPRGLSLLSRAGLLSRVALTPEGMPFREVREAVERLIEDDLRLFSISFHSPSLEPGHTPYVRDKADLDRFYRWWDALFDLFSRRGIAPATPQEILDAATAARAAH